MRPLCVACCGGGRYTYCPLAIITTLFFLILCIPHWKHTKDSAPVFIIWVFAVMANVTCALINAALTPNETPNETVHSNANRVNREDRRTRTPIEGSTSQAATQSSPRVTRTVMAPRGQYSHGTQLVLPFARNAKIARLAMRALPPVKSFAENQTRKSKCECAICVEEFKVGELIQPFGLCAHEFHSSCLYSWLHSGNTTCPVCRKDLATSVHARGTEEANKRT